MFNFHHERNDKVLLNEQTGALASISHNGNIQGNETDTSGR